MFSRRPIERLNRGRIASALAGGNPAPSVVVVNTPLDMPGLVSWWTMSNSLTADQGPGGNTLTAVGSPVTSALSLDGQTAYLFDGVDDYVTASGTAATAAQGAHYKWAVVELVANASGTKELFGAYNSGASAQKHQLRWVASSATDPFTCASFSTVRQGDTGGSASLTAQDAVDLATIVLLEVYDGTTYSLYCNGMLLDQSTASLVANSATFDRLVFGASFVAGVAAGFANYRLAEAGIGTSAPSAAYLTAFWNGYLAKRWMDVDWEMYTYMTTSGQENNANSSFRTRAHLTKSGTEYAINWDANDTVIFAKRPAGARTWQVNRTQYRPGGAYRTASAFTGTSPDNHDNILMAMLSDGTPVVSGGYHARSLRRAIGTPGSLALPAPTDSSVTPWAAGMSTQEAQATYPSFTPDGSNYLFCYRYGSSGGADTIMYSMNGTTGAQTVLKNPFYAGLVVSGGVDDSIYLFHHPPVRASGKRHIFYNIRDAGSDTTAHDLCYACIDSSGNVWQDPACTVAQTMPITASTKTVVNAVPTNSGIREASGSCTDESDNPMAVLWYHNGSTSDLHLTRWNGSAWTTYTVGGITTATKDLFYVATPWVLAANGWVHVFWVSAADSVDGIMCSSCQVANLGTGVTAWQTKRVYRGPAGTAAPQIDDERWINDNVFSAHFCQTSSTAGTRGRAGIIEIPRTNLETGAPLRTPSSLVSVAASVGVTQWAAFESDASVTLAERGASQWSDLSGNARHATPIAAGGLQTRPFYSLRGSPGGWPSLQGGQGADIRQFGIQSGTGAPGTTSLFVCGLMRLNGWVINRCIFGGQGNTVTSIRLVTGANTVCAFNGVSGSTSTNISLNRWYWFEAFFSASTNDYFRIGNMAPATGTSLGTGSPTAFGIMCCYATTPSVTAQSNSEFACLYLVSGATSGQVATYASAMRTAIATKYQVENAYSQGILIAP